MLKLKSFHRFATVLFAVLLLFLGITGTLMQGLDIYKLATHAPATDLDVQAIRESFDGPADFQVRQTRDYVARPLPAGFDYRANLAKGLAQVRAAVGSAPLVYAEFRMIGARPVARFGEGRGHVTIDLADGRVLDRTVHDRIDQAPEGSTRNFFKHLHRMTTFGDWALILNLLAPVALGLLIVTGLLIYVRLLGARRRMKRNGLFWSGGDTWRQLHRWFALVMALPLLVVTFSGMWLAIESAGLAVYFARMGPPSGDPLRPGALTPLDDARVPAMLAATLAAARDDTAHAPIKVLRLRDYAGYHQGVVVTGGAEESRQLVYNTQTGARMSLTEPGYPPVPFPFGWQAHEVAKNLHRGDIVGMPGRWIDLLAGAALIYFSVSGLVMYVELWRKRAGGGRRALFWK
jgi:uncharacterized iron-regulated membrane protein